MGKLRMLTLLLAASSLFSLVQSETVFDVLKYGAIADGVHKNTDAIAKAITAAHNNAGGGTVHFPNGTYLTGPIHFKSNVHLHLEEGCLIKFTDDFDDYLPMVPIRFEGIVMMNFSPLIYAYNQTNFGITGKGVLDGSGLKWWRYTSEHFGNRTAEGDCIHGKICNPIDLTTKWQVEFAKQNADLIKKYTGVLEVKWLLQFHFAKPNFFQPMYSSYITLEGVTFLNSPFWNINPTFSEHIRIHGITVKAPRKEVNTDGIDPDSCRNVTISDCFVDVGDDCIAIKAGKDGQAREIGIPCEDITITNLVCNGGVAAIAIGSEMSGSIRNVHITNVTAANVWNGVLLKTCRGRGGEIANVHITNMTVTNKSSQHAISIHSLYTYGCIKHPSHEVSALTPTMRDIYITDFKATSHQGLHIEALPEKHYSNIQLKNVHLSADEREVINNVDGLLLTDYTYHHIGK